jgi:hypothetical protein
MSSTTAIADTCARRGITRVVHCHADHWEPAEVAKRLGSRADVALWLERCRPAVPTLFVKPPLGFVVDPGADIGMSLRPSSSAAIEEGYLRTLVAGGVGIGLHVHHEAWTVNTLTRLSPGQRVLHDLALAQASQEMDSARMRTMTRAALDWLRSVTQMPLDGWHFVHGCWAFGASDPEICQLADELPLLYSLGCRADFSFPAGRRSCDPAWGIPQWVLPATGARAYEAGEPRSVPGDGRMLVWASHADDWWCGIDTYSEDSRRLTESADKLSRYLALCPVLRGTAYVKTCGHGMNLHYWQGGDPRPTLGAFARELEATCAAADVPLQFATTDDVVRELRG